MKSGKRQKAEVCKDLVIWGEPFQNCWQDKDLAGNYPLVIMEWKAASAIDTGDIDWLANYTKHTPTEIGYAIAVDFHQRDFTLAAVCVTKGHVGGVWKIV